MTCADSRATRLGGMPPISATLITKTASSIVELGHKTAGATETGGLRRLFDGTISTSVHCDKVGILPNAFPSASFPSSEGGQ